MKKKYYICAGCEAEIPNEKPDWCPLCGRKDFDEVEKEEKEDLEDKKYKKKYEEALDKLEEYAEGTEPEDSKYAFAD